MAKCADIVNQLRAVLPKYTDKFNNTVDILTWSRIGDTATITTDEDVLLSINDTIKSGSNLYISNVLVENPVVSITINGTVATCEVSNIHDFTENFNMKVKFKGISTEGWNSEFNLLQVPTQTGFTFEVPDGIVSPDISSAILLENRYGFNGYYDLTKIAEKTYTYELPSGDDVIPTTADTTNATLAYNIRIAGADSEENVRRFYTEQKPTDYWMFVLLNGTTASKSREVLSDATAKFQDISNFEQEIIQTFSLLLFIPQDDEKISSRFARDIVEDLRLPIFKSLLGVKFDSGLSEQEPYTATFISDEFFTTNGDHYIHKFNFETVMKINSGQYTDNGLNGDIIEPSDTVAFRSFEIDRLNEFDEFIKVTKGNLPS